MNSNGQRNFSYSSYYGQPPQEYLQSTFQQFNQYFNPESERAYEVLRAHYQNELQNDQRFVDSYKTVMCEKWLESGQCGFGKKCRFAHGFDDIRPSRVPPPINSKYKTRPCEKYRRGLCPYGQRCLFIHPERNTNNNSSMTPSSPSIEQQPPQPPIQSLLSWTPSSGDASWNHPPAPPPPTPHYYDSPAMATIPTPFKMASSIIPMGNSSASFAYSFPMVQPTRIVLASTQNQQQMMAAPNKSRNLFPQILEELQREKENSTTPTKTSQRRKKWSNFDREPAPPTLPTTSQTKKWSDLEPEEIMGNYDHQREMERIVERLVASPMLMPKQLDCNLT